MNIPQEWNKSEKLSCVNSIIIIKCAFNLDIHAIKHIATFLEHQCGIYLGQNFLLLYITLCRWQGALCSAYFSSGPFWWSRREASKIVWPKSQPTQTTKIKQILILIALQASQLQAHKMFNLIWLIHSKTLFSCF